MSAKVRVQSLRANEAGLSHFDSFEIEREITAFAPPALPFPVSESIPALCFVLLRLPTGWIENALPTPARRMLFCPGWKRPRSLLGSEKSVTDPVSETRGSWRIQPELVMKWRSPHRFPSKRS